MNFSTAEQKLNKNWRFLTSSLCFVLLKLSEIKEPRTTPVNANDYTYTECGLPPVLISFPQLSPRISEVHSDIEKDFLSPTLDSYEWRKILARLRLRRLKSEQRFDYSILFSKKKHVKKGRLKTIIKLLKTKLRST